MHIVYIHAITIHTIYNLHLTIHYVQYNTHITQIAVHIHYTQYINIIDIDIQYITGYISSAYTIDYNIYIT